MKIEAIPYYALGVGIALTAAWWFETHDAHTFEEVGAKQYCRPQIEEGSLRWGRAVSLLEPEQIEPGSLVRYRTHRSKSVVTSRVAAVQGQRIKIEQGKVYVDGKAAPDTYARRSRKSDHFPELIVPAGCVFVLNDQRSRGGTDRRDSRAFGPIPIRAISLCFSAQERREDRHRR